MRRPFSAPLLLGALVLVHVVWGLLRVPSRVVVRRLDDIAAYHERGGPGHFLDTGDLHGAAAIRWVLANTAPDSVVLWQGDPMGALEFAPTLLAPRLVVHLAHCPAATVEYAGRAVARAELDGRTGAVVLVATRSDLRVEVR
jgi:hypothetical protein